jgi:hypothetical protein
MTSPVALVHGFANGWLITPEAGSFVVELRFTPQSRVNVALAGSLAAALICLALVITRPGGKPATPAADEADPLPQLLTDDERAPLSPALALGLGLGMGLVGVALATPAVGALVGLLTVLAARAVLPRLATAALAPLAMALSGAYVVLTVWRRHTLPGLEWPSELTRAHPIAWFAVLALVADAVVGGVRSRKRR